jgi:hypothetical protein
MSGGGLVCSKCSQEVSILSRSTAPRCYRHLRSCLWKGCEERSHSNGVCSLHGLSDSGQERRECKSDKREQTMHNRTSNARNVEDGHGDGNASEHRSTSACVKRIHSITVQGTAVGVMSMHQGELMYLVPKSSCLEIRDHSVEHVHHHVVNVSALAPGQRNSTQIFGRRIFTCQKYLQKRKSNRKKLIMRGVNRIIRAQNVHMKESTKLFSNSKKSTSETHTTVPVEEDANCSFHHEEIGDSAILGYIPTRLMMRMNLSNFSHA